MTESEIIRDLVFEINKVAVLLGKPASEVTKAEFLKESNGKFGDKDFRKIGGFTVLKQTYISPSQSLKDSQHQKVHKTYVKKLERIAGNRESFQETLVSSVGDLLSKSKIDITQLDSKVTKDYLDSIFKKQMEETKKEQGTRSLCTIWSDQHFGTNVDFDEVGGKNAFNWVVGARRLGMLCEQIATYKVEKRQLHSELVIFLIGDNIGGVIHNQEGPDYDLYVHQLNGTTSYYIQALNYLKQFFPKIRVICQPGNHGRVQHKTSKDRALCQKYDSLENTIFYALSQVFASDPKIFVDANKAPFSDVEVQGHRVYATHGDTVFATGNVGKIVPIQKIEQQINSINAEELNQGKKPYEMICTGHVHHPLFTQVNSGVKVVINGCLIGTDSFAHSVGIQSSNPVQVLWETTKKFVQGDLRFIYVKEADSNAKYHKIIQEYKYQLVADKTN